MIATLILSTALLSPQEETLRAKLPDVFAQASGSLAFQVAFVPGGEER